MKCAGDINGEPTNSAFAEAFQLGNVDGLALEFASDYNGSPGSMQPVILWDEEFGTRTLSMMFWKFLPPYVTDPKKMSIDTILARADRLPKATYGANRS